MELEDIYKELFSEIIKSKIKIFGQLALKKGRDIDKIAIDNLGNVTAFSGDPIRVLKKIFLVYEEMIGRQSTISAKILIANRIRDKYPDLKLPEEFKLSQHSSR